MASSGPRPGPGRVPRHRRVGSITHIEAREETGIRPGFRGPFVRLNRQDSPRSADRVVASIRPASMAPRSVRRVRPISPAPGCKSAIGRGLGIELAGFARANALVGSRRKMRFDRRVRSDGEFVIDTEGVPRSEADRVRAVSLDRPSPTIHDKYPNLVRHDSHETGRTAEFAEFSTWLISRSPRGSAHAASAKVVGSVELSKPDHREPTAVLARPRGPDRPDR